MVIRGNIPPWMMRHSAPNLGSLATAPSHGARNGGPQGHFCAPARIFVLARVVILRERYMSTPNSFVSWFVLNRRTFTSSLPTTHTSASAWWRCTHRTMRAGQSAYLTRSQILITERLVRWARDAALYKCFGSLVLVTEMLRCSQCQEFCETWVATFPRAADSYYDFVVEVGCWAMKAPKDVCEVGWTLRLKLIVVRWPESRMGTVVTVAPCSDEE